MNPDQIKKTYEVIDQNPEDAAHAFQVFGDAINSEDPVWSEHITFANDECVEEADLKKAQDTLTEELQEELKVAEEWLEPKLKLNWRYGVIWGAKITGEGFKEALSTYKKLLSCKYTCFLQELTLGAIMYNNETIIHYGDFIKELGENGLPVSLKKLFIGDFDFTDSELSWTTMGDLSPILNFGQNLRELKLRAGTSWGFPSQGLELPNLKKLEVEASSITGGELQTMLKGNLTSLEALSFSVHHQDPKEAPSVGNLQNLLNPEFAPGLVEFGLSNFKHENFLDFLVTFMKSRPKIRKLSLVGATLSDPLALGVFKDLEVLDVSANYFSGKGLETLRKTLPSVKIVSEVQSELFPGVVFEDNGQRVLSGGALPEPLCSGF
jgi:hypothetical protein